MTVRPLRVIDNLTSAYVATPMPGSVPVRLEPGDVLLYRGRGFWSWAIRAKTWGWASHVEMYDRDFASLASRDGVGVRRFAVRTDGLVAVLRPRYWPPTRMAKVRDIFRAYEGQGYDWLGLRAFFIARAQGASNPKQFCSELVNRLSKKAGYPFLEGDSDAVSPWDFWKSPRLLLAAVSPDLPPRDRA